MCFISSIVVVERELVVSDGGKLGPTRNRREKTTVNKTSHPQRTRPKTKTISITITPLAVEPGEVSVS